MEQKPDKLQDQQQKQPVQNERKPNEQAGFHFSSALKITDPETGQVFVQMRAD
jgi:hypothetical protein